MSDETKATGDALAGSDASVVRVSQIYADLSETLAYTDMEKLMKAPEADSPVDALAATEQPVKEDSPEICHDNICDPTDRHILASDDPEHKTEQSVEQEGHLSPELHSTRLKGIEALNKKEGGAGNKEDEAAGLSENFILSGHSYL